MLKPGEGPGKVFSVFGRNGISTKAQATHPPWFTVGAGVMLFKRMQCSGSKCAVVKWGLCIDTKEDLFWGCYGQEQRKTKKLGEDDSFLWGRRRKSKKKSKKKKKKKVKCGKYIRGPEYAHGLAMSWDKRVALFIKKAESILRKYNNVLPKKHQCSTQENKSWNGGYGSDASQGRKALQLF